MTPPNENQEPRAAVASGDADAVKPYALLTPSTTAVDADQGSAPTPTLLAPNAPAVGGPVGWRERFSDLLLAMGAAQVGASIFDSGAASGVVAAFVLIVAIWRMWTDSEAVRAVCVAADGRQAGAGAPAAVEIAAGAVSLVCIAAAAEAFAARAAVFAVALVSASALRWCVAVWAARSGSPLLFRRCFAELALRALSGAAWIVGAMVDPEMRLTLWAFAATLDLAAPRLTAILAAPDRPGRAFRISGPSPSGGGAARRRSATVASLAAGALLAVVLFGDVLWSGAAVAAAVAVAARYAALLWLFFGALEGRDGRSLAEQAPAAALGFAGAALCVAADAILLMQAATPLSPAAAALIVGGPALVLLARGDARPHSAPTRAAAIRAPWLGPCRVGALGLAGLGAAWPILDAPTLACAVAFVLVSIALWRGHAARGPLRAKTPPAPADRASTPAPSPLAEPTVAAPADPKPAAERVETGSTQPLRTPPAAAPKSDMETSNGDG